MSTIRRSSHSSIDEPENNIQREVNEQPRRGETRRRQEETSEYSETSDDVCCCAEQTCFSFACCLSGLYFFPMFLISFLLNRKSEKRGTKIFAYISFCLFVIAIGCLGFILFAYGLAMLWGLLHIIFRPIMYW